MDYISFIPLELLKLIAGDLPVIQNVLSFSLVSRIFNDAINSDQVVYQALFLKTYEPPANPVGYDWKRQFRRRHPKTLSEEVVIEMILEARPCRKSPLSVAISVNISALSHKFSKPESIPLSLDTILYPMKLIQHAGSVAWRHWDSRAYTPDLHILNHQDILIKYREESSKIGDLFFRIISTQMQHRGAVLIFDQNPLADVKLEPYMLPNFWEGEAKCKGPISTRWLGGYLQMGDSFQLSDMRLTFTDKGIFRSEGTDIAPFRIRDGKIGKADEKGRRSISWTKLYDRFRWAYEGTLDYGSQRMTGVWGSHQNGQLHPGFGYGLFMFWAVPEDAPSLI